MWYNLGAETSDEKYIILIFNKYLYFLLKYYIILIILYKIKFK